MILCPERLYCLAASSQKASLSFHDPAATQITFKYHTYSLSSYSCLSSNMNPISSQTMQTSPLFPILSMEQEREDTLSSLALSWGNESNNISFSIFWYSSTNYLCFLNNVHWHTDTTASIWKESQCFMLPLVFHEILGESVTKHK